MTRVFVVAALLALAAPAAVAAHLQDAAEPPPPPAVSWRASVEWIGAMRGTDPAETRLNPGNTRFRIPQFRAQAEVRPNVRIELGPRITAVVRPRGLATAQAAWATGLPRTTENDASANWTEAYLNWRPTDSLQLTYGLQNFQWGPAELLAPSNRIFHETGVFRDQLYYVRGRHLLRVNLSSGRQWSLVGLAELTGNGEDPFVAGEPFRRQGQVKGEYAGGSGRGYIGVTAGARQGSRPWFGEYASYELAAGLSAYADATHTRGSRAWYPVALPSGAATFVRRDLEADAWRTLAVAGVRYAFVAGPDARLEYLYQDAGYTRGEVDRAAAALGASPTQAAPFTAPGLEFLGRRLALASLRVPDLPPNDRLALQGRYLRSFTDRSGVAFLTGTLDAADAVVLFASGSVTHGRDTAEFSRLAKVGVVAGAVWTW
ncbi:MAG: hypothetical protein H0X67_10035 [Acidobacteria bacterium]|nr:hypothetical protein [Acidobacteriota bacterium]